MGHAITLNLPDETWQSLIQTGRKRNEAPEAIAEKLLSEAIADPLISLFGSIESAAPDVSASHDEYVGASITAEQDRT